MSHCNIYTILQICDSAFPTGGFSHSSGAEAAVQHHQIQNKGSSCIPFIKAAHEDYRNLERLKYLDSLLNASLLNHVAHRASKQQGKSFLTTSHQVYPSVEIIKLKDEVEDGKMHGHLAVVFAVVCGSLNIPAIKVAEMYLYNSLRTVIASMVRLGKVGAVQAQQYQFNIQEFLDDVINRNWMLSPEDSYISFPLPETLQNIHDIMFTKLFYS